MRQHGPLLVALGMSLAPAPSTAQGQPAVDRKNIATIAFLDVGQGDAILIRSPEGKTPLIYAGPSREVVPLLKQRGVTSIDLVVVTHHHADHYGGMEAVIRGFRPRIYLATDSSHTTPHYLKLLTVVRDSGMQAIFPTERPRKINLGSVVLTVFPQPHENKSDENDNSIGIRVQYEAYSALLTGDSEARERAFWEANVPDLIKGCTVLKLAHHGSRNGTDARWLGLVGPQLAVASLGRDNEFGHPHPETLTLLARYQIPLLRTDIDGTIEVVSDGKTWGVVGGQPLVREPPVRRPSGERGEATCDELGGSAGRGGEFAPCGPPDWTSMSACRESIMGRDHAPRTSAGRESAAIPSNARAQIRSRDRAWFDKRHWREAVCFFQQTLDFRMVAKYHTT